MNRAVEVLYEDNHILVVNKPPGMLTQGDRTGDTTLLDHCKEYLKVKYDKPGRVYLGLVHRLDRPTGGVLLLARTSKAAGRLSDQFRKREVEKTYLAVCRGQPVPESGELLDNLEWIERTRRAVVSERGKKAHLRYRRLAYSPDRDRSLLEVALLTGRKHQIRAQLAAHGHALLGDVKYGIEPSDGGIVPAVALWSHSIKLIHPVRKEPLQVSSLPPIEKGEPWYDFATPLKSF